MKRILWKMYDAAANEGAGGTDATAVVLKAIDGMKAGMVKKEDVETIAGDKIKAAVEPVSAQVEEIKATVKALNEKAGQLTATGGADIDPLNQIAKGIKENLDAKTGRLPEVKVKNFDRMMVKTAGTMTVADDLTSGASVLTYKPGIEALPGRLVNFRSLVSITNSSTGTFAFYREGAKEGSIAFQSTHGNKKSIINARMAQVTVVAEYLAGLAPIAKQMIQDLPFMASFLPQFLLREYLFQEDAEFYDDLINAATGSTTITGTPTNDVEQVMGWVANLQAANYQPNGIVVNPKDLYKMLISKGSVEYGLPAGVAVTPSGGITIMGIPVYLSTFVAEDKVLVGDWTKATIVQVDGLSVASDDRGDNFDNNTVTYKIESRVALAVLQPAAFVYGDLGNVS